MPDTTGAGGDGCRHAVRGVRRSLARPYVGRRVAPVWTAKSATRLFPIRRTALVRCRMRPPPGSPRSPRRVDPGPGGTVDGHGGEVLGETFGFVCARHAPSSSGTSRTVTRWASGPTTLPTRRGP